MLSREEATAYREEAHALIRRLAQARGGEDALNAAWGSSPRLTDLPRNFCTAIMCSITARRSRGFICDPRLTDQIACLIGPNIQLHHTKLLYQAPRAGNAVPAPSGLSLFSARKAHDARRDFLLRRYACGTGLPLCDSWKPQAGAASPHPRRWLALAAGAVPSGGCRPHSCGEQAMWWSSTT